MWQIRLELADKEASGKPVTLTVVDRLVDERREAVLTPKIWTPTHVVVTDYDDARVVKITGLTAGVADKGGGSRCGDTPVILDLRDLLWGYEAVAVEVADLFLSEGQVARWLGRRAGEKVFEATPDLATPRLPVVLVGMDTEGVGEILASALQRAGSVTVGWRTAAHAPHMRFIHSDDLHLWIPVGQWMKDERRRSTAMRSNPSTRWSRRSPTVRTIRPDPRPRVGRGRAGRGRARRSSLKGRA